MTDTNLAAAILMGLTNGSLRIPHITDGNRRHTERAPAGSHEEAERIAAAAERRARRAAKRAQT